MYTKMKKNLFNSRTFRVGSTFVVFALIVGIYFLFKPFPAGPSLDVVANVPQGSGAKEAASVAGWSAYANPPALEKENDVQQKASAVQRMDIGAGYVLENNAQGSRIVAPKASSLAARSASSAVQRLDIGAGYVLENGPQGTRIVTPSALQKVTANALHSEADMKIDIGGGYMLVLDLKGRGAIVPAR